MSEGPDQEQLEQYLEKHFKKLLRIGQINGLSNVF